MAKASLNNIYDRLNGVASYHPFTADTFADWSLEAGDIVTIGRDGQNITSPVSATTIRWNGSQQVSIESRGEKERESVAKMSAKAFNSGGNGGAGFRSGGRRTTQEKDMYTTLTKSDESIRMYAVNRTNALETEINIQAGRIDMVVTKDGKVRAGIIVDAINADSSVKISADRVVISGNTSINDVLYVSGGAAIFKVPVSVGGGSTPIQLQNGAVTASSIRVRSGGTPWDLKVADASLSSNGSVLTITKVGGDKINFSKATTLEASWNSSTRRYTAIAYQNNGTKTQVASISTVLAASIAGSDIDWDGYMGHATVKAQNESGTYVTAATNVLINAKGAYDNGAASVTHNPTASATIGWTGGVSGRTSLGSATASSLAHTYILIDANCSGHSKGYYITLN